MSFERGNLVHEARSFAYEKHKGQQDKLKEPYVNHLSMVATTVRILGGSIEEIAAAYLHDVVEDCKDVTFASLIDHGFPPEVVRLVWAVTKKPLEHQPDYLKRVIATGEGAMRIKMADLLHNLRPDRVAKLPTYTQTRLKEKYQPSLAQLMMLLGYLQTAEEQEIALATDPVGTAVGSWSGSGYPNIDKGQPLGFSSSYFTAAQLMAGDWPAGVSAPIKEIIGASLADRSFKLENDALWSPVDKLNIRTWSKGAWKARQAKEPKWSPAQEKQFGSADTKTKPKVTTTVKQLVSGKKK